MFTNQRQNQPAVVLLLDADGARRSVLKRGLQESGYEIAAKLDNGDQLLSDVEQYNPDILVIGIDAPDTRILQQLLLISEYCPKPVIMFAEKEAPKLIEQVVKAGVNAFVVNDIQAHRLRPIINIATARFNETQTLRTELKTTQAKLSDRKTIDKAKGLLMKNRDMSEDQAYQSMRKSAMDKGKSLASVAENVIDVFSMLEDNARSPL